MERSILNTLAYRILAGQRAYGELHEKKKEWNWEAAEEGLDQAVYLACALVAFTEDSKRRYFSELGGGKTIVLEEPPTGPGGLTDGAEDGMEGFRG